MTKNVMFIGTWQNNLNSIFILPKKYLQKYIVVKNNKGKTYDDITD